MSPFSSVGAGLLHVSSLCSLIMETLGGLTSHPEVPACMDLVAQLEVTQSLLCSVEQLAMNACMHVYSQSCAQVYVCAYVYGGQSLILGVLQELPCSLSWDLLSELGQADQVANELFLPLPPRDGTANMYHHTQLFMWMLRTELRTLCHVVSILLTEPSSQLLQLHLKTFLDQPLWDNRFALLIIYSWIQNNAWHMGKDNS